VNPFDETFETSSGGSSMARRFMLLTAVVVSIVGVSPAVRTQAPQSEKPPEPAKPGPEHQRLGYFVGTWNSEGEMKPGPMGPGGKMTGKDRCEWYEGRFAVICHSEGTGPMGPSKGLAILGYSPEEKVYTYYGTDSSGMMSMTTVPRGTVKGDTWTYTDESTMGGQKIKSRVTLKEVSPTVYTFTMETQGADGKWTTMMEAKQTKVK
jgi:Protein of unknown function (DUF1579)